MAPGGRSLGRAIPSIPEHTAVRARAHLRSVLTCTAVACAELRAASASLYDMILGYVGGTCGGQDRDLNFSCRLTKANSSTLYLIVVEMDWA